MKPLIPQVDGQAITQLQSLVAAMYNPPTCIVRRVSDQAIVTATGTDIDFLAGATVEKDTHSMFDVGASDRITVARAGVYHLSASVRWASDATGNRHLWITVGANTLARTGIVAIDGGNHQQTSCVVACAAGDIIQMFVRQTSGGDLGCAADTYSPRLSAIWLRA
jgi:hypothetical protein